jgi:hypothetical protein
VQETQCPQCGEWLGVPPEFADRPVRCGACGRVIPPHERHAASPPPPPPPRSSAPRFPDAADTPAGRGPRFPDAADDEYTRPRRKGAGVWVWVLLAVGGFGFCCCGGGVVLFFAAANAKWEPYTPDNAAFTAEFPTKPVYKTEQFNWKDNGETVGTSHQYAALLPLQQLGVGLHYADLPKSMKGFRPSDEKLLKLGLEDFKADSNNFTVQSSAEVTVGKYKGRDVEGTMTDPKLGLLQVSLRVVIVGDRVFTLIAAGKDRKKVQPMRDRFFNSFKPADPKVEPADPKGESRP